MKLGVVMDPIESINFKKDSTLAMMLEAQSREHQLFYMTPDSLYINESGAFALAKKVYVKNDKGNVVKVEFGDPNMEIKRDDPARRKSFRARHNCDNPGPKYKARYWSCKFWEKGRTVTSLKKG